MDNLIESSKEKKKKLDKSTKRRLLELLNESSESEDEAPLQPAPKQTKRGSTSAKGRTKSSRDHSFGHFNVL